MDLGILVLEIKSDLELSHNDFQSSFFIYLSDEIRKKRILIKRWQIATFPSIYSSQLLYTCQTWRIILR